MTLNPLCECEPKKADGDDGYVCPVHGMPRNNDDEIFAMKLFEKYEQSLKDMHASRRNKYACEAEMKNLEETVQFLQWRIQYQHCYEALKTDPSPAVAAELSRLNVQWDLNDYPKGVEPQTATEANLIYCQLKRLAEGLKK